MTGTLAPLVEGFFTQRLIGQRHASPHTVASYRDTFRLLFCFAQQHLGKPPAKLDVADLDAPLIGRFLDHLETERHNSARTRNNRLAAIHSLFGYAGLRHPEHAALIQRVLAIPAKRTDRQLVSFLTNGEIEALLAAPDRTKWIGRRDHALLLGVASHACLGFFGHPSDGVVADIGGHEGKVAEVVDVGCVGWGAAAFAEDVVAEVDELVDEAGFFEQLGPHVGVRGAADVDGLIVALDGEDVAAVEERIAGDDQFGPGPGQVGGVTVGSKESAVQVALHEDWLASCDVVDEGSVAGLCRGSGAEHEDGCSR